jgi:hypothetical protein
MGLYDRVDWGLQVEQAVQEGLLAVDSRGYRVTQQVMQQGFSSLSPEQRCVYIAEVLPALNEMARRQYMRERCASAAA